MIDVPFDAVDEADLLGLVAARAPETRTLEFKREIGRGNTATTEFLRDLTAMANAQGGDLLIGVIEEEGVAVAVPGVAIPSLDEEGQRFENIIRSCVEPRLANYRMRFVPVGEERYVVHFRLRPSMAAPHAVRDGERRNYFMRNSSGKHEMDAAELRQAFTASEQMIPRLRRLHEDAIGAATGRNMPFRIDDAPRCILSIIPIGHLRDRQDLPVTPDYALVPPESSSYDFIPTLEGLLVHTPYKDSNDPLHPQFAVRAYALNHWSGRLDIAWTIGAFKPEDKEASWMKSTILPREREGVVWPASFEKGLLGMTQAGVARLRALGLEGPWLVLATLDNLKGALLSVRNGYISPRCWRDQATLPELVVDDIQTEALMLLLRSFWLLFAAHRPAGLEIGRD